MEKGAKEEAEKTRKQNGKNAEKEIDAVIPCTAKTENNVNNAFYNAGSTIKNLEESVKEGIETINLYNATTACIDSDSHKTVQKKAIDAARGVENVSNKATREVQQTTGDVPDVVRPTLDKASDRACETAERLVDAAKEAYEETERRAVVDDNSTRPARSSESNKRENAARESGDVIEMEKEAANDNAQDIVDAAKSDLDDAAKDLFKNGKDMVPDKWTMAVVDAKVQAMEAAQDAAVDAHGASGDATDKVQGDVQPAGDKSKDAGDVNGVSLGWEVDVNAIAINIGGLFNALKMKYEIFVFMDKSGVCMLCLRLFRLYVLKMNLKKPARLPLILRNQEKLPRTTYTAITKNKKGFGRAAIEFATAAIAKFEHV